MKTSTGFEQCYNGQLAVDGEFQIIVANHQGNNASDNGYLVPLLDEAAHYQIIFDNMTLEDLQVIQRLSP